jgi:hypothetical protein
MRRAGNSTINQLTSNIYYQVGQGYSEESHTKVDGLQTIVLNLSEIRQLPLGLRKCRYVSK